MKVKKSLIAPLFLDLTPSPLSFVEGGYYHGKLVYLFCLFWVFSSNFCICLYMDTYMCAMYMWLHMALFLLTLGIEISEGVSS